MKPPGVPPIQVPIEELEGLLEQARPALSAEGYQKLRAAIRTLVYVTELLEQKETTLAARRAVSCVHPLQQLAKPWRQRIAQDLFNRAVRPACLIVLTAARGAPQQYPVGRPV